MPTEPAPPAHLGDHLLITTGKGNEPLRRARAILIQAHSLLGTLLGYRLVDLRASGDRIMATQAEIEELGARLHFAQYATVQASATSPPSLAWVGALRDFHSCFPLRPHQALRGGTPAEVCFGDEPPCRSAVRPPRATDADAPARAPFRMS